jgi:hypothetical protein
MQPATGPITTARRRHARSRQQPPHRNGHRPQPLQPHRQHRHRPQLHRHRPQPHRQHRRHRPQLHQLLPRRHWPPLRERRWSSQRQHLCRLRLRQRLRRRRQHATKFPATPSGPSRRRPAAMVRPKNLGVSRVRD